MIPRACSSGRESRNRTFPESFEEMMPLEARRASESVVLPENEHKEIP